MTLQVSPTQSQIQVVLRAFLLAVLPAGVAVVAGQANRVAEPGVPDFVIMTPTARMRLSTNVDKTDTTSPTGNNTYRQSTQVTMQLDVHGPNASDNIATITTMFRDGFAVDFFKQQIDQNFPIGWVPVPGISPLHADNPRQMPFINAESQYEFRWVIEAELQVDETVTNVPQGSALPPLGPVNIIDVPQKYSV